MLREGVNGRVNRIIKELLPFLSMPEDYIRPYEPLSFPHIFSGYFILVHSYIVYSRYPYV